MSKQHKPTFGVIFVIFYAADIVLRIAFNLDELKKDHAFLVGALLWGIGSSLVWTLLFFWFTKREN